MDAVFRVADRITVMVDGRVIASDAPAAIRADPDVQVAYLGESGVTRPHERVRPAPAPVDARDVHARYGQSHVLHGVSLAIRRGESVGLLGRNGMGKTTLIRTVLGYVAPAGGTSHRKAATSTGARPSRSRGSASATCRKAAASSRTSRCARTS